MKNFKSFLNEVTRSGNSGINTSQQNQAIDNNVNMSVYSDPSVVKKLNAWVGTIAGSYALPEDAIHRLRSSLSNIGLSFDEVGILFNLKNFPTIAPNLPSLWPEANIFIFLFVFQQ